AGRAERRFAEARQPGARERAHALGELALDAAEHVLDVELLGARRANRVMLRIGVERQRRALADALAHAEARADAVPAEEDVGVDLVHLEARLVEIAADDDGEPLARLALDA